MSFNYSQLQDEQVYVQQPQFQQPQVNVQQPQQFYPQQPQVVYVQNSQQPNFTQQYYHQSKEFEYPQQSSQSQNAIPVNPMNPQQTNFQSPQLSRTTVIFILSAIFPGLGHIVLGQLYKGLFIVLLWIVSLYAFASLIPLTGGMILFASPFVLSFIWFFATIDSSLTQKKFESGEAILQEVKITKEQLELLNQQK
eukprot:gene8177-5_t